MPGIISYLWRNWKPEVGEYTKSLLLSESVYTRKYGCEPSECINDHEDDLVKRYHCISRAVISIFERGSSSNERFVGKEASGEDKNCSRNQDVCEDKYVKRSTIRHCECTRNDSAEHRVLPCYTAARRAMSNAFAVDYMIMVSSIEDWEDFESQLRVATSWICVYQLSIKLR